MCCLWDVELSSIDKQFHKWCAVLAIQCAVCTACVFRQSHTSLYATTALSFYVDMLLETFARKSLSSQVKDSRFVGLVEQTFTPPPDMQFQSVFEVQRFHDRQVLFCSVARLSSTLVSILHADGPSVTR